jgi:hypothetical protein
MICQQTLCDSVHVSYFGSYKGPTVEQQCALCYRVIEAISEARNAHLNAVKEKGSENISLLDTLVANTALPFVTNDKDVIALLKGLFKPHRPRGTGSGTNSIDKLAKKEAEDNWKKQLKEEELLYPCGFGQHQTASRLAKASKEQTASRLAKASKEQAAKLASYKLEAENTLAKLASYKRA